MICWSDKCGLSAPFYAARFNVIMPLCLICARDCIKHAQFDNSWIRLMPGLHKAWLRELVKPEEEAPDASS